MVSISSMEQFLSEHPYNYHLPADRIAQRPVRPYHLAKMLVIEREKQTTQDLCFYDLPGLLRRGDLLVFNDSQVIPARLIGNSAIDQRKCELLLVRQESELCWCCLGKPLSKLKAGAQLCFGTSLSATVLERIDARQIKVQFNLSDCGESFKDCLERVGIMPIPPYIRQGLADRQDNNDYRTYFGNKHGSVAAPTASLHFTPELEQQLHQAGIEIAFITLHIGAASFLPLWDQVQDSAQPIAAPAQELLVYSQQVLDQIKIVRHRGNRVIAVGTTVVRALESMHNLQPSDQFTAESSGRLIDTALFISPGYSFQAIDGLITNFHQPRTTHLLLVQALLGRELLERAYQHALSSDYRFLSYGDGMIIL